MFAENQFAFEISSGMMVKKIGRFGTVLGEGEAWLRFDEDLREAEVFKLKDRQ
jgi:hypothetical protein